MGLPMEQMKPDAVRKALEKWQKTGAIPASLLKLADDLAAAIRAGAVVIDQGNWWMDVQRQVDGLTGSILTVAQLEDLAKRVACDAIPDAAVKVVGYIDITPSREMRGAVLANM